MLRPGAVFMLSGRASRAPFWFGIVCGGAAIFMVAAAILGTAMLIGVTSASVDLGLIAWSIDGRKVTFSGVLPLLVIGPVTVRRLHDRDRPAWWLLVFFGLPPLLPWIADRVAAQIEVLAVIVPEPLAFLPDLVRVGYSPSLRSRVSACRSGRSSSLGCDTARRDQTGSVLTRRVRPARPVRLHPVGQG